MPSLSATAIAHPNIALIKYWGNRNQELRLPSSGSVSINLSELYTRTRVTFKPGLHRDSLTINRQRVLRASLARVTSLLDIFRQMTGKNIHAEVVSENNFPAATGLASSAAAFAALTLAAARALELNLTEVELSRLARRGSGSACRSIPPGFVEWQPGQSESDSYAYSIASPDYWKLADCIALIESAPKQVGSTEGHVLADSSPLQASRLLDTPRRIGICRRAIFERDFEQLAEITELDSNMMHAVMMTSQPAVFYWEPVSLSLMKAIPAWRKQGIPVCYTLDAGPNVHCICPVEAAAEVKARLQQVPGVAQILYAEVSEGARLEAA